MRIKENFYLSEVGNCNVVIALGEEATNLNAVVTLNESATFLWKKLELGATREALAQELIKEYDIDLSTANNSVDKFIEKLEDINCIVKN